MKQLHTKFGPGLEILLFPSDEFGGQELPSEKIPAFVEKQGLPLDAPGCHVMAKVKTNGPNASPIWSLAKESFPGDVTWNFAAIFLFDKEGNCVARKSIRTPPTESDIQALL
mmetsp:Transcript_36761/g.77475  ORF Transcript_36761/g.77475 Transcript_36761/m.77475 type:complete len:112 (-) Transcript_36761:316-651(-)